MHKAVDDSMAGPVKPFINMRCIAEVGRSRAETEGVECEEVVKECRRRGE